MSLFLKILVEYLITFGWAFTGAISMAFALGMMLKIFDWLTPIDEWEEIRKGNITVAIILAAVIIAFAIVIASVITPK